MRQVLGRGVGSWTSNKDAEFSNFIFGNNDFINDFRDSLIEKARLKALADKKAKKEAEANTKEDEVVSDKNLGLEGDTPTPTEVELLEKQRMLELRMKKPPYLLYGGIGLVVIVGAIFIFTRK
jgi:hypothetical protein|tara:strand:+ start:1112 stop:1480 length:369 start_codon:yes stop_codon:yes gene_type:complete